MLLHKRKNLFRHQLIPILFYYQRSNIVWLVLFVVAAVGQLQEAIRIRTRFILGLPVAEFGKQPMEVVTGKILQINILVELLVPLLWLRVMKTSFMWEKVKIPCVVMWAKDWVVCGVV